MKPHILKPALTNAVLTVLYIFLVASFLQNAGQLFGGGPNTPDKETVLIPIMMLLLFVLSAGITGFLVFGKPVMWYLDGKKHEAVSLLGTTLACLFIIFVCVAVLLSLSSA